LKIKYESKNNRALHAANEIKVGERFLFVPKKLIITFQMGAESPLGKLIFSKPELYKQIGGKKHVMLTTFIL